MHPCSQICMWSYDAKQVRGSERYSVTDLMIHTLNALCKYALPAPPGLHVSMQPLLQTTRRHSWRDFFFIPGCTHLHNTTEIWKEWIFAKILVCEDSPSFLRRLLSFKTCILFKYQYGIYLKRNLKFSYLESNLKTWRSWPSGERSLEGHLADWVYLILNTNFNVRSPHLK